MIHASSAPLRRARRTARHTYRKPPVHEVVLSLVFGRPVDTARIEALAKSLQEAFPVMERQDQVGVEMTFGPGGSQVTESKREFAGFLLKDRPEQPTRAVLVGRTRLNVHAVRPGLWPSGEYAGWPAIFERAFALLGELAPVYADAPIERAGLRYLNRIAVPDGTELDDWFTIGFAAPALLLDPFAMNLRQTWARVEEANDMSVSMGFATIKIPDPALEEGHVGFLLDIEVFNLYKNLAPSFSHLPEWCRRAHDVEGDIFEMSITPKLRDRFEVITT